MEVFRHILHRRPAAAFTRRRWQFLRLLVAEGVPRSSLSLGLRSSLHLGLSMEPTAVGTPSPLQALPSQVASDSVSFLSRPLRDEGRCS